MNLFKQVWDFNMNI